MKKLFKLFLGVLLIFTFGVKADEITFSETKTLNYNGKSYTYEVKGSELNKEIYVDYKGCQYTSTVTPETETFAVGDLDCKNLDMETGQKLLDSIKDHEKISMEILKEKAVEKEDDIAKKNAKPWLTVVAVVCIIWGLISVMSPKTIWLLSIGWLFKKAKPSKLSLSYFRVSGFILLLLAFILIIGMIV